MNRLPPGKMNLLADGIRDVLGAQIKLDLPLCWRMRRLSRAHRQYVDDLFTPQTAREAHFMPNRFVDKIPIGWHPGRGHVGEPWLLFWAGGEPLYRNNHVMGGFVPFNNLIYGRVSRLRVENYVIFRLGHEDANFDLNVTGLRLYEFVKVDQPDFRQAPQVEYELLILDTITLNQIRYRYQKSHFYQVKNQTAWLLQLVVDQPDEPLPGWRRATD